MTFREQIAKDMQSVMTSDEFDAVVIFNGAELRCICETEESIEQKDFEKHKAVKAKMTITTAESYIETIPMPDERVTVDGDTWTVKTISPVMGELVMTLERYI